MRPTIRFLPLLAAFCVCGTAMALDNVKLLIPANPGGGWDQTGRQLATAMQSAKLVSGVQFDNKGGAAGRPRSSVSRSRSCGR